jgi:hypothetical protein
MENGVRGATGAGAAKTSNPQRKAYPKFAHEGWAMRKSGADAREDAGQTAGGAGFFWIKNF